MMEGNEKITRENPNPSPHCRTMRGTPCVVLPTPLPHSSNLKTIIFFLNLPFGLGIL